MAIGQCDVVLCRSGADLQSYVGVVSCGAVLWVGGQRQSLLVVSLLNPLFSEGLVFKYFAFVIFNISLSSGLLCFHL